MKLLSTTLLFCVCLSLNLNAQVEVWHFEGNVEIIKGNSVNKIGEKQILEEMLEAVVIKDSLSYICLIDQAKNKLIELNLPGSYRKAELDSLMDLQMTLPKLKKTNLKGYKTSNVLSTQNFTNWAVFPNSNRSGVILVGKEDTLIFNVSNNDLKEKSFEIKTMSGNSCFERTVYTLDTVEFQIKVSDMMEKLDSVDGKLFQLFIVEYETGFTFAVEIISDEKLEILRSNANNLLKQNTRAYKVYALLYLLDNEISMDAYKLLKANVSEIRSFYPKIPWTSNLSFQLGLGFIY